MSKRKFFQDREERMRWAVSIFIASIGLLVGGLGVIPRCDEVQLKAHAKSQHSDIMSRISSNKIANDKEHQRIYDELKAQGRRIEKQYEAQRKSAEEMQKTLWSVYREVKK